MAGIGVILNPHSRSNRKNPERVDRLGFIVGDKGSCHETKSIEDVKRLAAQFRDREIEILGISGGDGTLHATLTTFVHVYGETPLPQIALLRGGTMNNVANVLGIRGTPEQILFKVIHAYHRSEIFRTTELNLIRVNGEYGFVFAMGAATNFLRRYYGDGTREPTPFRAVYLISKYLLACSLKSPCARDVWSEFEATVTVDGKKLPFDRYHLIASGTVESVTLGLKPLHQARKLRNELQVIAVSAPPQKLIRLLPSAWLARTPKSPHYLDEVGKRVVIEPKSPIHYVLDGEIPGEPTERIELSLGPRLTWILP